MGEIIYLEDVIHNVMCRRWNWRNANLIKITQQSKHIVINLYGIGRDNKETIVLAQKELAKLLQQECNAHIMIDFLSKEKNETSIAI